MSIRKDQIMALAGQNFTNKSVDELKSIFTNVLNEGIHGLGFSPYQKNQQPGNQITEEQIRKRMEIIKPYTKWIRSFSTTDGNENIPRIAHEYGIKTLVGAWLGTDKKINEQEIQNVIKIAKEGYADIVAVGNEVMYREDLTENQLIEYIKRVKEAIPTIPVGYVDAYYEFEKCSKITEICDVVLANCYPFWEGCHIDYSLIYMKDMYQRAVHAAKGKKVIISEAGWPSQGQFFHGAQPSIKNAITYFINTQLWSKEEDIEILYFSSFDEPWKISAEGDLGAYWGLWDKDEMIKY